MTHGLHQMGAEAGMDIIYKIGLLGMGDLGMGD